MQISQTFGKNGPRLISQYSNMTSRRSGQNLSLNSQKRLGYKENNTNIEVCPKSLGAVLEYCRYIEHGAFASGLTSLLVEKFLVTGKTLQVD